MTETVMTSAEKLRLCAHNARLRAEDSEAAAAEAEANLAVLRGDVALHRAEQAEFERGANALIALEMAAKDRAPISNPDGGFTHRDTF